MELMKLHSPMDIIIPVMGITGSGKSSFIARCSGNDAAVGHGLRSCTQTVSYSTIKYNGQTVRLIDTPGFNDTQLEDSEILMEISTWLSAAYEQKPPLLISGIVYLHPITSVRMKGSDKTALAIFQAMCGRDALTHIVMATTMWAKVDAVVANDRYDDLKRHHWKDLVDAGARPMKHKDTRASALEIIDHIIHQRTRVTLAIQEELAAGVELRTTKAGRELTAKLRAGLQAGTDRLEKLQGDFVDAQRRRDEEDEAEIASERRKLHEQQLSRTAELEQLRKTSAELLLAKEAQLASLRAREAADAKLAAAIGEGLASLQVDQDDGGPGTTAMNYGSMKFEHYEAESAQDREKRQRAIGEAQRIQQHAIFNARLGKVESGLDKLNSALDTLSNCNVM